MATQYIHFTEEQKQTARQTDIAELLRRQGQTLKRSGSEYEWKDGSAKVTVRGNLWFHQYDHEGGDAIDFVRRFMGKSYPEAVEFLLSGWRIADAVSADPEATAQTICAPREKRGYASGLCVPAALSWP